MSALDFLKEKKAEIDYKSICDKMSKLNLNMETQNNGCHTLTSKVGSLEYRFNERNQNHNLSYNGKVVFDREDLYTDTIYNVLDQEQLKNVKIAFKTGLLDKNIIDNKSSIRAYEEMVEKMNTEDHGNLSIKCNESDDYSSILTSNKIGHISLLSNKKSRINGEMTTAITLKLKDKVVYESLETPNGLNILKISSSAIPELKEEIENNPQENKNKSSKLRIKPKK